MGTLTFQEAKFVIELNHEVSKKEIGPALQWFKENRLITQSIGAFEQALCQEIGQRTVLAIINDALLNPDEYSIPESIEIPWRGVEHMRKRAMEVAPEAFHDIKTYP